MPIVNLFQRDIEDRIGKLTEDQFEELCFSFGLELDEITSEYDMVLKEQGSTKAMNCSKDVIYKVEVPANRYDLLCLEGLMRALMVFEKKLSTPRYICSPKVPTTVLNITVATKKVRPFAVAAILRNITFSKSRYDSFLALQDKLHMNIGRKRSIVSIGTHDLDTIKGPFTYDAKKPSDITFIPLNESKEFTAEELMIHYSSESHLKTYLPIIRDCEVYPIMYDSCGTVLSLPPIINGDHSKITLATRNVFIEITATNLHKASVTLDTIVTMFAEYCDVPFEVEPVEVRQADGTSHVYPELSYRKEVVSVDYVNNQIGTTQSATEMATFLDRMSLKADVLSEAVLSVEVPPTRHDVLHRVDIVEDVAIAFGFDNIPEKDCVMSSIPEAGLQKSSKITNGIRDEMLKYQFIEPLTFVLCSREDISTKLGRPLSEAVSIENPKTKEFNVCRTDLLPGLLSSISSNQSEPMPMRVFEVQDVVLAGRNERRLCAVHYGMTPEFESVHEVLAGVLSALGLEYVLPEALPEQCKNARPSRYTLVKVEDGALMQGRSLAVLLEGRRDIGRLGTLRSTVLPIFGLRKGFASTFEINVEPFF